MRISIVMPAYNEERLLGAALESVRNGMAAFAERGWQAELIVCDNNSTDRTADIAAAAGATVVFEPVNQIARARNAGAAVAAGDWLIFVDADSRPSRELFEDVAQAIGRGECLAGGSTVRFEAGIGLAPLPVHLWNGISRLMRWAAGSFIFCRADAFRAVGRFSETLYAAEEIDLFRRLKRVARKEGRRIAILHRHPLLTSGRKLRLYGWREQFSFAFQTVFARGRTLRSAKDCFLWYDGRR